MATVTRVVRVANPRRKVKRVRRKKKAVRAKVSRRKTVKKNSHRASTKRRVTKRKVRKVVRRKRNPIPVLIELGAINPKRRKKNVAKRRIKRRRKATSNPKRRRVVRRVARKVRRRRTRRNPVVVVTRRRRRNSRRRVHARRRTRRNGSIRRRRNPSIFGRSSGKDLLMMIGGGLLGVAATKFLPTLLPSGLLGGGPIISLLLTAAGAFGASFLFTKFNRELGEAVLFGGLMQAASSALTAFAPPALAARLALSGLGDIVPGNYVVPQNPLKQQLVIAQASNGGMGALRRGGNFR